MLVASWSRTLAVVAYSSVLYRTKSSAYIAHFTGDGNSLIRSLMNTKKSVGDMTPPCSTLCLRSIFLLFVLSMTTIARRLCRYHLIQQNIFPAMLHFFSFRSRPSVQTVSNAFCRSIHTGIRLQSLVLDMLFDPQCNDVLGNRPALRQANFQI